MKKILLLIGNPYVNFFDPNSAVGSSLLSVKKILEENNFEVILSHAPNIFNDNKVIKKRPSFDNIKSLTKKLFKRLYLTFTDLNYLLKQKDLFNSILKKGKFDHIIEFSAYGSQIGYKLKSKYKIPLTLIYDSPANEQFLENNGLNTYFKLLIEKNEKHTVENSDYLICYSNPVKNYLNDKYKLSAKNIFIFPTINWNKLEYKSESKRDSNTINIGFIGSFLKWHKVDLLVDAFTSIVKKHNNLKLYLIGYGQEWDNIQAKIINSNLQENIYLTGFVSDNKLSKLKSILDIGIMPGSNWYGGPLKIFEYAYLKIPVIAPATPTIEDLFVKDKEILYIDDKNETESLISQIEMLIQNKDKRKELGENLYNNVRNNLSKEKYTAIFKSIIEN